MNFPVFSQLAGNFGFPETGSLETASSSSESANFRSLPTSSGKARCTGMPKLALGSPTTGELQAGLPPNNALVAVGLTLDAVLERVSCYEEEANASRFGFREDAQ